jgi:16S rRNA A1518/A1519 N6-dimethyltransferase RsmA/KsgA/DIM1 with predicted DNA glycosylase/AP lyase activity
MLYLLYFLYFLLFLLVIIFILFATYHIYANIFQPGAIYYPTTDPSVNQMLKLAKLTSKDTLIDIGSGDGRILIAAARLGAKTIGYEINPFLVQKSRHLINKAKLDKLATVHWKSFWKADFRKTTVVTVYLFPHLMNRLHQLIQKKAKHPIRIVTNTYPFPNLTPTIKHKKNYLYNILPH